LAAPRRHTHLAGTHSDLRVNPHLVFFVLCFTSITDRLQRGLTRV
jgi:hypothetical protein